MGPKRPSFMPALAAIQLMLAVALAALSALHIYLTVLNSRQGRRIAQCQINQQAFQGLINQSIAYATRTNPALIPALADAGLRIVPSTNPPPVPGSVPPVTRNPPRSRSSPNKP